jgi:hypothetical protein
MCIYTFSANWPCFFVDLAQSFDIVSAVCGAKTTAASPGFNNCIIIESSKEPRPMTRLLVALFVVLGFITAAHGHEEYFGATIDGVQENPDVGVVGDSNPMDRQRRTSSGAARPESFGNVIFVLNDSHTALTMRATIFNIDVTGQQTPNDTNDNLAAAHIHAPPDASVPFDQTMNVGVVWGFFGSPQNDINPNDQLVIPFAAPAVGGTFINKWDLAEGNGGQTLATQLANLLAVPPRAYINFHTTQFGGGEIRGNLQPVPEPSTLILFGLGLLGLAGIGMRRRLAKAK